ncbi:MAG: 6-carboxytetrahydropterin synthase [Thermoflexaceae bacterium]|nr:6-carboxytetrahydropterin synthase [Thermoflexaceae bacterium]
MIRYRIYRYKFYLDANHYIYSEKGKGAMHPHTWEFAVELKNKNGDFVLFRDIEKVINDILLPYQNTCLNEQKPFDKIVPTLENIGEYFEDTISEVMYKMNWELLKVEISETPSRSYIVLD